MLFTGSGSKRSMERLWPTLRVLRAKVGCIKVAARSIAQGTARFIRRKAGVAEAARRGTKGRIILKSQPLSLPIIPPRAKLRSATEFYIGNRALALACANSAKTARLRTR